ncbi:MAG TPA: hypothetical protein VN831_18675 [Bradyrhizobium sp.]|nr:hypothetical protein [Bradyrhizobium sp.]
MDFDHAFDTIAIAMTRAANERSVASASSEAERHGLVKQGGETRSLITIWEKTDQGKTLWFRWRCYDQSQVFSIKPDMNILSLELRGDEQVLRRAEERYED